MVKGVNSGSTSVIAHVPIRCNGALRGAYVFAPCTLSDAAVMDIAMLSLSGNDATAQIALKHPQMNVDMLSLQQR